MDLSIEMGKAIEAARRGDVETLERELVELRRVSTDGIERLAERLRVMARCVHAHPSYSGEGRAEAV